MNLNNQTFNVEEKHRGEWIPFIVKNKDGEKVQKQVKITENQAERLNVYKEDYKFQYILAEKKETAKSKESNAIDSELKEARAMYKAVTGNKCFNGWDVAKINEKIAEANGN